MTAENFDVLALGLQGRRPFRFFTIELQNGHHHEIDHPKAILIQEGVAVFYSPGTKSIWFDHESVVQIYEGRAEPKPSDS